MATTLPSRGASDPLDWVVFGVSLAVATTSIAGAAYAFPRKRSQAGKPPPITPPASRALDLSKEFTLLWLTRIFVQIVAAMYMLSLLLRLQVLWGPSSAVIEGGYQPIALCRANLALAYGLLEPAFLLLAVFSCLYSLQGLHHSVKRPNYNIIFYAVGFSLPTCAAQVICGMFTQMIELDYSRSLYRRFFAVVMKLDPAHCRGVKDADCVACLYPLLSTLVSVLFGLVYLSIMVYVTSKVAEAALNKRLQGRIRAFQLSVSVFFTLSVACRGVSVLFQPFDFWFDLLRLLNAVCIAALVVSVSVIMVLRPVHDARSADRSLAKYAAAAAAAGAAGRTELVPLVTLSGSSANGSQQGDLV